MFWCRRQKFETVRHSYPSQIFVTNVGATCLVDFEPCSQRLDQDTFLSQSNTVP